jgi:hypothetical protein
MATTANRDYFYPGVDDAPAGPFALESLAEAVDLDMNDALTQLADLALSPRGVLEVVSTSGTSGGLIDVDTVGDLANVALTAGRWYRAMYRFTSLPLTASQFAVAVSLRKSATADTTAGTSAQDVSGAAVVYTANSGSGKTHHVTFLWQAGTTETVNIKAVLKRLTGSGGYDISARKLSVHDEGARA